VLNRLVLLVSLELRSNQHLLSLKAFFKILVFTQVIIIRASLYFFQKGVAVKMSEPPAKKSQPTFTGLYPSKAELDYLADIEDLERLQERLKDRTIRNLILDVEGRRVNRPEKLPADVLRLIALYMDIRVVLDLAKVSVIYAKLTMDDSFWANRFAMDFPEIPSEAAQVLRSHAKVWKGCYFVVNYVATAFYRYEIGQGKFDYTVGDLRIKFSTDRLYSQIVQKKILVGFTEELGRGKHITIAELAEETCKRVGTTRTKLPFFLNQTVRERKHVTSLIFVLSNFFHIIFATQECVSEVYMANRHSLLEVLRDGYVTTDRHGRPVLAFI
jgi:hypothetical protein